MIQRPSTDDSAYARALVHEEAVESAKESRRHEPFSNWQAHMLGHNLPNPMKLDKPSARSAADDRRAIEASRASASDDKVCAL
jgi:hypothetical protein